MSKPRLPVLLSYGDMVYRPAGYRVPNLGEMYVAKDGHIKRMVLENRAGAKPRLIVRVYRDEDFKK